MHGDDKIAVKERWIIGDLVFATTPPLAPNYRTAPIYLPVDFPDQNTDYREMPFTKKRNTGIFLDVC